MGRHSACWACASFTSTKVAIAAFFVRALSAADG